MNINSKHGFHYLLRGFKLLNHPKLRPFVIIPLLINTFIFIGLLLCCVHQFNFFVNLIDRFLPHWLLWLNWLLWTLFAIASLLVISYTFSILANLIAAPFNSLLSAKTEQLLTGKIQELSFKDAIKDIPRILKHETQKILYYLPRALLCFLLFFIPVIQAVAPFAWFIFNSWMMSLQYLDYPMDNHQLNFNDVRKQLVTQKLTNLSFGSTVMLATMIPVINFIVMPAAVVGATIFWIEEQKSTLCTNLKH